MSSYFPIVKLIVRGIAFMGGSAVVANAIAATTPANLKGANKVLVYIGSAALSGAAGNIASEYALETLEEISMYKSEIEKIVDEMKDNKSDEEPGDD